ncbi:Metallo-dependent phosphatase-like protein [Immersiella caudata]|uniref:Metallo-dependent phosphatase-like protein n=1 Tax=Immersiella caudata TaxID=314043 RepID=A0AA40C678_9PEZI|nr:Metallo-dependent phosphatase-like protein [Immersiella caudata]
MGVRTIFLIISDTHADGLTGVLPRLPVNIAIHCGDLTEESKIRELQATVDLLKSIDAPLKLVIPGNHDFTLNVPVFKSILAEVRPLHEPELVKREYGDFGDARELFERAASDGIRLLDEGTHHFALHNGAQLKVYASPYTASRAGDRNAKEKPQACGYPGLFEAVARSRPRMHCFGHIHEAWGAKLVVWGNTAGERPSHLTAIDDDKSTSIETLAGLRHPEWDTAETAKRRARCNTLFINAGIQNLEVDGEPQLPRVVDIDLPILVRK